MTQLAHQLTKIEQRRHTHRVLSPKQHRGYNVSWHPLLNRHQRRSHRHLDSLEKEREIREITERKAAIKGLLARALNRIKK